MYSLYFLTIFGMVRSLFGQVPYIWMDDMPDVDRIYSLCTHIYLCRDYGIYYLEEDLFAKLIFLMRSRETCINYTRSKFSIYIPRFIEHRYRGVTFN